MLNWIVVFSFILYTDAKTDQLFAICDKLETHLAKILDRHRIEMAGLKLQNDALIKQTQTLTDENVRLADQNTKQQRTIDDLEAIQSELIAKIGEDDKLIMEQTVIDLTEVSGSEPMIIIGPSVSDQNCDLGSYESPRPRNQGDLNKISKFLTNIIDDDKSESVLTDPNCDLETDSTSEISIQTDIDIAGAALSDASLEESSITTDQIAYVPDIGAEIECDDDANTTANSSIESNLDDSTTKADHFTLLGAIIDATASNHDQSASILQHECLLCPKKFTTAIRLSEHQTICWQNINSNLSSSSVATLRQNITQKRLRMETGFACPIPGCNTKYNCKRSLAQHIEAHKNGNVPSHEHRSQFQNNQVFACSFAACNLTFTVKDAFDAHISTHTKQKQFECQYPGCKRKFWFESILIAHAKFHAGYYLFKCVVRGCRKRFTNEWHFIRHQQTHLTGESDRAAITK